MTRSVATLIARHLNGLRGSSASGMRIAVNVETGECGTHLFSDGSRPRLDAGWSLFLVGPRYTIDGLMAFFDLDDAASEEDQDG